MGKGKCCHFSSLLWPTCPLQTSVQFHGFLPVICQAEINALLRQVMKRHGAELPDADFIMFTDDIPVGRQARLLYRQISRRRRVSHLEGEGFGVLLEADSSCPPAMFPVGRQVRRNATQDSENKSSLQRVRHDLFQGYSVSSCSVNRA